MVNDKMKWIIQKWLYNQDGFTFITVYFMEPSQKTLNVLLCQTHPTLKKKQQNIQKFDQHLNFICQEDGIDIIIFPEMSFTGYNFKNYEDALPESVFFGQGLEFQYARALSHRLTTYVLIGYIQKISKNGKIVLYNSAALCDRQGKFIFNTRKTHLYYADELWSQQGQGFNQVQIKNKKGENFSCAVGICMDINEKKFTSGKREFGDYVKQKGSEVILFPTNWINSNRADKNSAESIYNYWMDRLQPLLKPHSQKKRVLLVANRVGEEYSFYDKKKFWFMGSSCAITINPTFLVDRLGKDNEGVLKLEVSLPKL